MYMYIYICMMMLWTIIFFTQPDMMVCMYVWVCVWLYVCMYVYVYTYIHTYLVIHICIHVMMLRTTDFPAQYDWTVRFLLIFRKTNFTYVYTYLCTYVHACMHKCIHKYIHTFKRHIPRCDGVSLKL